MILMIVMKCFIIEDKKKCLEKCEYEAYIFINEEKNYCESENSLYWELRINFFPNLIILKYK